MATDKELYDEFLYEQFQATQKEEPGLGSKALDYGMRALDYTAGLGRVSAAGLAELASFGQADITQPGDVTAAFKGQAPTTEDYLERSGMEDGALRTGLGFAGDVALDPATYLTAGGSVAKQIPKLAKVLTLADKPVELGLKGIGKAYKTGTRKVAPRIASAMSGSDTDALKSYIKDPDRIKKIAADVFENTDTAVSNAKSGVWARKSQVANDMNEVMRESGKQINIGPIKSKLDDSIEKLTALPRRSPQQQALLEQLGKMKEEAFTDIVGDTAEEIPSLIDADRMFDLKESLRRNKSSNIFTTNTGEVKQVDKRLKGIARDLYGDVNKEVDRVFAEAKPLREAFSDTGKDLDFLEKRFKQDHVRPEADTNALLRLSKNKETKKKLQKIDELYGSNITQAGSEARGAFQLADPSLIPVSGQGVVSTGRIAASSAIGAQTLGSMAGGTRGGAAAGLLAGMLGASPAVMSRGGRAAYKAEQLMTPMLKKAPTSIYRRMAINEGRE